MKIAILWTHWSGYMDACAKELQAFLDCELQIFCFAEGGDAPFKREVFFKFPCKVTTIVGNEDCLPTTQIYDCVIIGGWHVKPYRHAAISHRNISPRILCMDNQWAGTLRQFVGLAAFRCYLNRLFDFAFVPGLRQAQFASYLGFRASNIVVGNYSCAWEFFDKEAKSSVGRSQSFLFVGRLVKEKAVDVLADAWELFNERGNADWRLKVCGAGPMSGRLENIRNLDVVGFVQPNELPALMRTSSALVLPSRKEPWGLVVHEAAASGLGLIVSEACGAADYFLRDGLNGYRIPSDDVLSLANALESFSGLSASSMSRWRERSVMLAARRTPSTWVCDVTSVIG